jgi:hypothetical protein
MSQRSLTLLLEIARCSNVEACLVHPGQERPCTEIVSRQSSALADQKVPEPWSGEFEAE